jgi:hypothetical protein
VDKQLLNEALEYKYNFESKYDYAKRLDSTIFLMSVIISLISIINVFLNRKYDTYILLISFAWTLSSIVISFKVKSLKKVAADYQELFDTLVFDININRKLMYPKNEYYRISQKAKLERKKYYRKLEKNSYPSILAIQHDNIIYDKFMRNSFKKGNGIILLLYIFLILLLSISMNLDIIAVIITLIMPSINTLVYLINNAVSLSTEIKEIDNAVLDIKCTMIKSWLDDEIYKMEIREYQDFIYQKRRNWVLIPNVIYKIDLWRKQRTKEIGVFSSDSVYGAEKKHAIRVANDLGIVEFLHGAGEVGIVGSVANDLIVGKDIDIHLYTKKNIYEVLEKLKIYIMRDKGIGEIDIKDYYNNKEAVCLVIKNYKGWQIEVWITNNREYTGFELSNDLRRKLTSELRTIIKKIKICYYERGLLVDEMSTIIYKAVVYENVRSINEFETYLDRYLTVKPRIEDVAIE